MMLIHICLVLYGLQTFLSHLIPFGKSLILSCFVVEETEVHRGCVLANLSQLIHGEVKTRVQISTIFMLPPPEETVKMSWI